MLLEGVRIFKTNIRLKQTFPSAEHKLDNFQLLPNLYYLLGATVKYAGNFYKTYRLHVAMYTNTDAIFEIKK